MLADACWHTTSTHLHVVSANGMLELQACCHVLSNKCYRHVRNVVHAKFDTDHPPLQIVLNQQRVLAKGN